MGSYTHTDLGALFVTAYVRENVHKLYGLTRFSESPEEKEKIVWDDEDGARIFAEGVNHFLSDMEESAVHYAGHIGVDLNTMHCTLSFAVIGPERYMTLAIGDSPIQLLTNNGMTVVDGNGGNLGGNLTYSAVNMDNALNVVGIHFGLTVYLKGILMTSDGIFGYREDEVLAEMEEDLPKWFYSMIRGKITKEEALGQLVSDGYDDCSLAYYVHDDALYDG
jgi:hypothetical protein